MAAPASIRRTFTDLPIPWKLSLMVSLFCVVVGLLLTLSYCGMEILSGCRSYSTGEGLWSKAEKTAVYKLTRYALDHDEADYQAYLEEISIPFWLRKAREELAKPQMDEAALTEYFIKGRNHPADIRIQTLMARHLHNTYYMHRALVMWVKADQLIEKLPAVADALHREISSGHPSAARVKMLLDEARLIDARLTPLQDDFSFTLGEWARWLKKILIETMIAATLLFLATTLGIAYLISRHLCREIAQLQAGAYRIAAGDYTFSLDLEARDEIGELARTFHEMAMKRQQAEHLKAEYWTEVQRLAAQEARQAKELDDLKSAFLANSSHDLRSPMTAIFGYLNLILNHVYGDLPAEQETMLKRIDGAAKKMLNMLNNIVELSQLAANQMPLQIMPFQLQEVFRGLEDHVAPQIRGTKVDLECKIDGPLLFRSDRAKLQQILVNLAEIAVKWTSSGVIALHAGPSSDRARVRITVCTPGKSLSADEIAYLFKEKTQLSELPEGSTNPLTPNMQVGLLLCKKMVELLGGEIAVQSQPNQSTTFTLDVPREIQKLTGDEAYPPLAA